MAPSRKRVRPPEAGTALPGEYEELALLHTAVLAVCGFLAPKGVPCTLERLVPAVGAMSRRPLALGDLQRMVAIDNELALRAHVSRDEDRASAITKTQPEIILRRAERMALSAGTVRARQRRFRQLLMEHFRGHAVPEGAAHPPLPLAPLPAGLFDVVQSAQSPVHSNGGGPSCCTDAVAVSVGSGDGGFIPAVDQPASDGASAGECSSGAAARVKPAAKARRDAIRQDASGSSLNTDIEFSFHSPPRYRPTRAGVDSGCARAGSVEPVLSGWSPERQALKDSFAGLPSPPPKPLRRGTESILNQWHSSGTPQQYEEASQEKPESRPDCASIGVAQQGLQPPSDTLSSHPSELAAGMAQGAAGVPSGSGPNARADDDAKAKPLEPSSSSRARLSPVDRFLERVRLSSFYRGQLVYIHEERARPARTCAVPRDLHPAVMEMLRASGIESLYSHQGAAVEQLLGGGHVMLSTPTASGKSLAYNLPVLNALVTDPKARALYIFPTKALAQDQLRALRALVNGSMGPLFGLRADTYDGDTPEHERRERRDEARVLLTNPDTLHASVLPHHKQWADVLCHLRFVVVDEAHMYGGAFGAHVALILRRLWRLAAMYRLIRKGGSYGCGDDVADSGYRYACCSATLGNPRELFESLTGIRSQLLVVDEDGAPHGRRQLVLWQPPMRAEPMQIPEGKGVPQSYGNGQRVHGPILNQQSSGSTDGPERASSLSSGSSDASANIDSTSHGLAADARATTTDVKRESANIEGAVLFAEMVRAGLKVICFCSVRKICELVLDYARQHLRGSPDSQELARQITAYRGGLNVKDRRRIERQLYDGVLRGVTATSTLELGVDIAALDATVIVGFPGSVSSLWQRAGRCGRDANMDALCVVIAYPSAIDQWVMRNPERVLSLPLEACVVDIDNPTILAHHLVCAAAEEPLNARVGDAALFDASRYQATVSRLVAAGSLIPVDERHGCEIWRPHALATTPQSRLNIRTIDDDTVRVVYRRRQRRNQRRVDALLVGSSNAFYARSSTPHSTMESGPSDSLDDSEIVEEVIDEVESWRIYYELYEGAIILNQGRKFQVVSLDLKQGVAQVVPADVRYYTHSLDKTSVIILQRFHGSVSPSRGRTTTDVDTSFEREGSGLSRAVRTESRPHTTAATGCHHRDGASGESRASSPGPNSTMALATMARYGRVRVQLTVSGFVKIWQQTGEIFEELPLYLPPKNYDTRACWIDLPPHAWGEWTRILATPVGEAAISPRLDIERAESQADEVGIHENSQPSQLQPIAAPIARAETDEDELWEEALTVDGVTTQQPPRADHAPSPRPVAGDDFADLDAALHAASHAVMSVIPLHLTCSASDIGCECSALREHRLRSRRLLFYDKQEGGIGLTQRAASVLPSMLRSARDMVASCTCAEGCWMCVHWSKCPEYNACTSKKGALAVLDILLSAPPPHAQNPCATPPTETPDDTLETAQPNPCATATRDEESSMLGKSVAIFRRLAHANQRRVLERMGANPTT